MNSPVKINNTSQSYSRRNHYLTRKFKNVNAINRSSLLTLLLALFSPLFLTAQQSLGCATDGLHHHLQSAYPQGIPNKPVPATDKTDDYDFSYVIPVVFHVMENGGPEGSVGLPEFESQIEVLNEDYNLYGSGYNADPLAEDIRISFCMATVDPDGNPTPGYEYVNFPLTDDIDPYTEDTLMKRVAQWDPDRYLNIFIVRRISNGTIRGYAFFPDEVAGSIWDGVTVDYRFIGRDNPLSSNQGRTVTHEVGHYLGLYHPWGLADNGTGCYGVGDGCDDTPPVDAAAFANFPSCTTASTACDGNPRQFENYMDYAADRCMNLFTICQGAKMRTAIGRYRTQLVSADNLVSTGCKPIADTLEQEGDFLLYPIPATDRILAYPISAEGGLAEYRIFDATGRIILKAAQTISTKAPISVDLGRMPNGIYWIEMVAGGQTWLKKFLVDR